MQALHCQLKLLELQPVMMRALLTVVDRAPKSLLRSCQVTQVATDTA